MPQKVRVLIATTAGPVEIESINDETAELGGSVACIAGGTSTAAFDRDYRAFVAARTGIIARFFGHDSFRLDVSHQIDTGLSWQLPVFIAHALHSIDSLAHKGQDAGTVLVATGTIRVLDQSIVAVGFANEKVRLALDTLRKNKIDKQNSIIIWPEANGRDVNTELREELKNVNAEVLEPKSLEPLLLKLQITRAYNIKSIIAGADTWEGSPSRRLRPFDQDHRPGSPFGSMPNKNESPAERAPLTFGELLAWHLMRGTRPRGDVNKQGREWTAKEFAAACGYDSDRTVRNWIRDQHLPSDLTTVESKLFGNNVCYSDWRLKLREAHKRGRGRKPSKAAIAGPDHRDGRNHEPSHTISASNIPIRVPTHFIGRDDVLAAIEVALARNPDRVAILALQGLRGIGKTTLAAAYAERHRREYRATWWIRAQDQSLMRSDVVALGVRLRWVLPEDAEERALAAVMERLRYEDERILLIYDNALDADSVAPYLPRAGSARVLITSNFHALRSIAEAIELPVWSKETGADYLIVRTGRTNERDAAEALSRALDGLPLAHEQAAAYCDKLHVSLAEYLQRFERTPSRFLDDTRNAPRDYNDGMTVAKSFTLGIEEAAKLHPGAEPLIVHAAFLAPEPIPLFLFAEGRAVFGEPLASALLGEGIYEVVAALSSFALLKHEKIVDERDPTITTDAIRLHRLVREVAAGRRDTRSQATIHRINLEILAALYPHDVFDNPKNWPRARRLDEHGVALVTANALGIDGVEEQASQLLDRLASYRQSALATYGPAKTLYEQGLAIRERAFGAEHPLTAASLHNLARLLRDQGQFEGSRSLYERALGIREKILGPDHRHTAATLNNLASLLQAQGANLDRVRSLFERALAIREKVLGSEHPNTAASLINVARVLRDQGEFTEARPFAERGLAIREKVLGREHPRTAAGLNVLASALQGQGDLIAAQPLFERALAICENILGPEHPYTATSLTNLALLSQAKSDYASAFQLFKRALSIREKVLGAEHPSTATSLNDIANLLWQQSKAEEARQTFERALLISEQVLGPEHPTTATSLNGLARLFQGDGNLDKAQLFFRRALAIRENVLGTDHPAAVAIRETIHENVDMSEF
jgi:tetratricopeptide (TPR) repeat protein